MKRFASILALIAAATIAVSAQTTDWLKKYQTQVAAVGLTGPGVESVLNRWGQADSSDLNYLRASYIYYLNRGRRSEIMTATTPRYLGREPMFALPDTTTKTKTYYYQIEVFDDEPFGKAIRFLDKLIAHEPTALELRVEKISDLIIYEGESPDMALSALLGLITEDRAKSPKWTYEETAVDREFFDGVVQEFCANLFQLGTDPARDAMLKVSERMLTYDKNAVPFITNQGSYYMAKKDYKKALKYFDKAIKVKEDSYNAIKNACTIGIVTKDLKLQKKYLPMLVKYGNEAERLSAQSRLDALK